MHRVLNMEDENKQSIGVHVHSDLLTSSGVEAASFFAFGILTSFCTVDWEVAIVTLARAKFLARAGGLPTNRSMHVVSGTPCYTARCMHMNAECNTN